MKTELWHLGRACLLAAVALAAGTALGSSGDSMPDQQLPAGRNRLAGSTSPYLLQHQDNPVDWYPWGEEAFAAARAQGRPIFLSIGYSACHWCHVMEHESFEDPQTAALMNQHFVNIKVDREERPDLDDIYMTAVQMLTGGGGWPMSVWLTPDLKPFYGGTYFPPDNRYGRPSFRQVISRIGEAWRNDRTGIQAQAQRLYEEIASHLQAGRLAGASASAVPDASLVTRAITEMTSRFDRINGGFGTAPKFPPHRGLALMLRRYRQQKDENLLRMATLTYDAMLRGGLYDQIGGGFHRYATDAAWQVPHFEKMLYDNALLAEGYLDAWQTTGSPEYERIVREVLGWILREMTDAGGGFHSTLDADSEGEEGKFYVWRLEEVTAVLGEAEGSLASDWFGITPSGNFEGGSSIPHLTSSLEEFAARRKLRPQETAERLGAARARLLAARARRVRPHLDDKVLTAWNGMTIAALARAGRALDEPGFLRAAERAADFLLSRARGDDGLMRVSWRAGRVSGESLLDDQAFMIRGLLALHEATGEARWLKEARALQAVTDATFWDPAGHGYYSTPPGRADLIVRAKNPTDGATPSGNSILAGSLLRLARLTGEASYARRADEILGAFAGAMASIPGAFHNMLGVLDESLAAAPGLSARPVVDVSAKAVPASGTAGGELVIEVTLDIKAGWHVNSAAPLQPHLIPTRVTLEGGAVGRAGAPDYPDGSETRLPFEAKPLSVWQGRQSIRLPFRIEAGAPRGPAELRGAVTWQACNDSACLLPERSSFSVPVTILPAAGPS